jgi:hypothetical protein
MLLFLVREFYPGNAHPQTSVASAAAVASSMEQRSSHKSVVVMAATGSERGISVESLHRREVWVTLLSIPSGSIPKRVGITHKNILLREMGNP